jgi:hypothetical protein
MEKENVLLLDKNSRIGIAIWTVAEIFERLSRTPGSSLYMASFISSVHVVSAITHWRAHRDTRPNSRHLISRC